MCSSTPLDLISARNTYVRSSVLSPLHVSSRSVVSFRSSEWLRRAEWIGHSSRTSTTRTYEEQSSSSRWDARWAARWTPLPSGILNWTRTVRIPSSLPSWRSTTITSMISSTTTFWTSKTKSFFDLEIDVICFRAPQSKQLRDDQRGRPYIRDVKEIEVRSSDEAIELLNTGLKRRRIAHTQLNTESSRSHSVLSMRLVQYSNEIPSHALVRKNTPPPPFLPSLQSLVFRRKMIWCWARFIWSIWREVNVSIERRPSANGWRKRATSMLRWWFSDNVLKLYGRINLRERTRWCRIERRSWPRSSRVSSMAKEESEWFFVSIPRSMATKRFRYARERQMGWMGNLVRLACLKIWWTDERCHGSSRSSTPSSSESDPKSCRPTRNAESTPCSTDSLHWIQVRRCRSISPFHSSSIEARYWSLHSLPWLTDWMMIKRF